MTVIVYHDTPKRGKVGHVYRDADSLQQKLQSLMNRRIAAVVRIMETGEEVGSVEKTPGGDLPWNWWFDPSVFEQESKNEAWKAYEREKKP